MTMTIRLGILFAVAGTMMACGGASSDSIEPVSGGSSALDGKDGKTDPNAKGGPTETKDPCPTDPAKDPGTKDPQPTDPNKDPGKEPPKDPGTGDPSSCIGDYLDGICQSDVAWKEKASSTCEAQGLQLTDIYFGSTCGKNGEIGEVKFLCCK